MQQNFLERLVGIDGVIWDLDNTLYRLDEALMQAFHHAVARAALDAGVDLDIEAAAALACKSFADHGYSGRIFVQAYGIDDVWLHHKFHHYVDETLIERNAAIVDLFARLDLKHALITHGSGHWARRVLEHLGLREWFDETHILALEDYGFQKKAESAVPFVKAIDRLGLEPEQLLFVEDTSRNLAIPYDLGMGTVLLHYGRKPQRPEPYVHAHYDNALELLQQIVQQKSADKTA